MLALFPRLQIFSFQRVFHWQRWELSEDGKFLLIVHDTIQIFRHSSLAKYTIVSLEDRYKQVLYTFNARDRDSHSQYKEEYNIYCVS